MHQDTKIAVQSLPKSRGTGLEHKRRHPPRDAAQGSLGASSCVTYSLGPVRPRCRPGRGDPSKPSGWNPEPGSCRDMDDCAPALGMHWRRGFSAHLPIAAPTRFGPGHQAGEATRPPPSSLQIANCPATSVAMANPHPLKSDGEITAVEKRYSPGQTLAPWNPNSFQ